MIVQHFLKWIDTAQVNERAAAANALARAYITSDLSFEDRCAAEAALTLLLDDPSPKVRAAMAEPLSMSPRAPIQIISALAADQAEVAGCVLVRSELLTDGELIDLVAAGDRRAQRLIASRGRVSKSLSAAIAEVADVEACLELLGNTGAEIADLSFRRMGERVGHDAALRAALLGDRRLPPDVRHTLVVKLSEALRDLPLVVASIGQARAERMVRDACVKASLSLIDGTAEEEYPALIEHLRIRGDLTTAFLVRTVAHGKIDFFGAVLVALSGQGQRRVRALLSEGRDVALRALFRAAGLADNLHVILLRALQIWRDVARGKRVAGAQEVTWSMLAVLGAIPGKAGAREQDRDLADLLKSIHIDELRANARGHAIAIAAA
ncbi:MAG: DUF2336 domain-containing protein [Rhizobiaceae bacterium]